jgi:hypothetical protein
MVRISVRHVKLWIGKSSLTVGDLILTEVLQGFGDMP